MSALVVPVHYDFASALCYVAHRTTARLAAFLAETALELRWTPIELGRLTGWRGGAPVPEPRRRNVLRVAEELGVPLRLPAVWTDAREAAALAIALEGGPAEAVWRERVFSAVFEEGRDVGEPGAALGLAGELGLRVSDAELRAACAELERRTERAAADEVSGVPTFMLGRWPLGGIQDDATMCHLLGRFARRAREGALA